VPGITLSEFNGHPSDRSFHRVATAPARPTQPGNRVAMRVSCHYLARTRLKSVVTAVISLCDLAHGLCGQKERSLTPVAENLVNCTMMRRLFILVMAVTLGGLGQVPLSASALFSSNRVGCASAKIRHHCDNMNMNPSSPQLAAAENTSCCFVSGPPADESQFVVSAPTFAATPAANPASLGDTPRTRTLPPDIAWHDFSPPTSQSLLCIFLI
jgi:hypothetical protein